MFTNQEVPGIYLDREEQIASLHMHVNTSKAIIKGKDVENNAKLK